MVSPNYLASPEVLDRKALAQAIPELLLVYAHWFYHGSDGYNPAAGVGTMDVAKFADALRDLH
jgi:hypothetical protein